MVGQHFNNRNNNNYHQNYDDDSSTPDHHRVVPFPNEQIQSDSFNIRYMQETKMVPDAGVVSMFDRDMRYCSNADGEMTTSSINTTTNNY